ncbi:MAG: NADP-dependent isocitrate dehydrogenase [Candidatus Marsarchaeota archaeon]
MNKIQMVNPLVEIDGDEMARVMWAWVKESLILPYVDLKTEYYDLSVKHRDETEDKVTFDAAKAIKRLKVGVKCATITPNAERVIEYGLRREWPSPNATIRKVLDGTIFRSPISLTNVRPAVRFWKKPIVVARHAFGDIYDGIGAEFEGNGKWSLIFKGEGGKEMIMDLPYLKGPGVVEVKYNLERSIRSFAEACFQYSLANGMDLWFSAKDTISKVYDAKFKEVFASLYEEKYQDEFERRGLTYNYYLIDDAMARAVRSEGGFVWACKNYEGDILSDMVSAAYSGSIALMTSELFSPDGCYEAEAAHGTVQKHYYQYLKGIRTSTNPTATVFAWARALKKRGEIDANSELVAFAGALERAVIKTIEEDGVVTKDVAAVSEQPVAAVVGTQDFLAAVKRNLDGLLAKTGQSGTSSRNRL